MTEIGPHSQPLTVFDEWIHEARRHPHIREATAMTLATMDKDRSLHARVVLCKEWSAEGFVFYTNYQSRKGLDLAANPNAAAVFYWDALFRQVKISGTAHAISRERSQKYWSSRARESQISQFVSRQSHDVPSREIMEQQWLETEARFRGQPIPCPEEWGGYCLQAESLEFWIGRPDRFHDRFVFKKSQNRWTFRRLYP